MSVDPNGTRWSRSEKNFGKQLLEKAGWSEGSGLGKEQSGTVTHVKVSRKDDVMGIGYVAGVQETWTTQSVGFADVLQRIKSKVKNTEGTNGENDHDKTKNKNNVYDDDSENGNSLSKEEEEEEESCIFSLSDSHSEGSGVNSPTSPVESRHFRRYAKRNALKTELLREQDERKKNEILGNHLQTTDNNDEEGHKSAKHKRHREKDVNEDNKNDEYDKEMESSKEHRKESKKAKTKSYPHDAVKPTHESNHRSSHVYNESEDELMKLQSPVLRRLMVRCKEHEPENTSNDANNENELEKDATKAKNTAVSSSPSSSASRVVVTKPDPRPPKCTVTPFHINEEEVEEEQQE